MTTIVWGNDKEAIATAFGDLSILEDPRFVGSTILSALYDYSASGGNAIVIFTKHGIMYKVAAGHCDHTSLTGKWKPIEINRYDIKAKLATNDLKIDRYASNTFYANVASANTYFSSHVLKVDPTHQDVFSTAEATFSGTTVKGVDGISRFERLADPEGSGLVVNLHRIIQGDPINGSASRSEIFSKSLDVVNETSQWMAVAIRLGGGWENSGYSIEDRAQLFGIKDRIDATDTGGSHSLVVGINWKGNGKLFIRTHNHQSNPSTTAQTYADLHEENQVLNEWIRYIFNVKIVSAPGGPTPLLKVWRNEQLIVNSTNYFGFINALPNYLRQGINKQTYTFWGSAPSRILYTSDTFYGTGEDLYDECVGVLSPYFTIGGTNMADRIDPVYPLTQHIYSTVGVTYTGASVMGSDGLLRFARVSDPDGSDTIVNFHRIVEGDPQFSSGTRSEVSSAAPLITPSLTHWVAFAIRLGSEWVADGDPNDQVLLQQTHQRPDATDISGFSPPLSIQWYGDGTVKWKTSSNPNNPHTGQTNVFLHSETPATEEWVRYIIQQVPSANESQGNGLIKIWRNEELIVDQSSPGFYYGFQNLLPHYLKIGLYKSSDEWNGFSNRTMHSSGLFYGLGANLYDKCVETLAPYTTPE